MAALSTDVATLAYLQVWDTEKQRQCRYDDANPAESENARREQLFVIPTEQLTNWKWLPMPLNGPAVFFGYDYQTCFLRLTTASFTLARLYVSIELCNLLS